MSVAQFCKHITQHFKELRLGHLCINLPLVARMHFVPIQSIFSLLDGQKAIVLVNDVP